MDDVNHRPAGYEDLMQFTGLKDKNGKEIYEGDIVRQDYDNALCEVKFISGCFSPFKHDGQFVVIGNIYENPELLKP